MKKCVTVLDYGCGNLFSVLRSLARTVDQIEVIDTYRPEMRSTHLVLPGVGTYGEAMNQVRNRGLDQVLMNHQSLGLPILGICVGMQILTSVGYENGIHNGLNLVEGKTISLISDEVKEKESARIPNMGWMQVEIVDTHSPNLLFKNLGVKFDAYFAHSFEVRLENIKSMTSMSYFGERQVVASFAQDNVFGVQFHPEKSGKSGLAIIDNFLNSVYE